jgi:coenzyme F420-reducing hydrogenase alpha subunit
VTNRFGVTPFVDVEALTRVEGEGGLLVRVEDGRVADVELRIFEPPRFFEGFLRGRGHDEPVDLTARVCGICPVAYQLSACAAMEDAAGVVVPSAIRDLRRLLYCGEWIESHALHIHLLHAPDFLGYEHALTMAADHGEQLERGLRLKAVGNDVMAAVGGRAVHPVNVRLGGFHRAPTPAELQALVEPLRRARDDALGVVRWVAAFEWPDVEVGCELVAIGHPSEYPVLGDRIVSTGGLDIPVRAWGEHFHEEHRSRSTALYAFRTDGRHYLTGPLARYSLASGRLHPVAREAARDAGLGPVCRNPFQSVVVRAVEVVHACETALQLVAAYEPPAEPFVEVPPVAGAGHGVTEAPRGLLYHRYVTDADGTVVEAQLVPPTSQNQAAIEDDVRAVAMHYLDAGHDELTRRCEMAVRNHDPCISCATHFLDVRVVPVQTGK